MMFAVNIEKRSEAPNSFLFFVALLRYRLRDGLSVKGSMSVNLCLGSAWIFCSLWRVFFIISFYYTIFMPRF